MVKAPGKNKNVSGSDEFLLKPTGGKKTALSVLIPGHGHIQRDILQHRGGHPQCPFFALEDGPRRGAGHFRVGQGAADQAQRDGLTLSNARLRKDSPAGLKMNTFVDASKKGRDTL